MTIVSPLPNQTLRPLLAHPAFGAEAGMDRSAQQDRSQRAGTPPNITASTTRFSLDGRDSIVLSDAALAAYAKEAGAVLPQGQLGSASEAARYLEALLGRMVASADKIKLLVQAREALHAPAVLAAQGEARVAQLHAYQVGQQLAAEKDLQQLSAALARAFDLDRPIYRQDGGDVRFNAVDFNFAGRLLAQLMPDGRAHLLADGPKSGQARSRMGAEEPGFWAGAGSSTNQPSAGFGAGFAVALLLVAVFWLAM